MRRRETAVDDVEHQEAGATALRCWTLRLMNGAVVIDVWTPVKQKVWALLAGLVAAVPLYLLWSLLGTRSTSTAHWFVALAYAGLVLAGTVFTIDRLGRESIRLDDRGLMVRRFSIYTWVASYIETGRGAEVAAVDGAGFSPAFTVYTPDRQVRFARALDGPAIESIATHVRAMLVAPGGRDVPADGVMRRVTRHRSRHTPPGADDLIALEEPVALVTNGMLHWGPRTLPWAFVFWFGWVAAVVFRGLDDPENRLVPVIAATLALGAIVCRGGALDRLLARRRRQLIAENPDAPWLAVPYWSDRVIAMPVWRRGALPIAALAGGLAVVAWAILGTSKAAAAAQPVIVALAGAWCVCWAYRLQNVIFQGVTEVRLRSLPLPARGDVSIDFAVGARGADFEDIHFTLSRFVEVPQVAGKGAFVGYSHRAEYMLPEDQAPPAPGEQVEVHFTLPPDASGTDLTRGRPVYWMLEVRGMTSSGFYAERFPIPIYDERDSG